MKKMILFLLLSITVFLAAQFYEPIQINENLNPVYYRGNGACKIIGEATYITFDPC